MEPLELLCEAQTEIGGKILKEVYLNLSPVLMERCIMKTGEQLGAGTKEETHMLRQAE